MLVENKLGFTILGPIGAPDPTDFINLETRRLPFKSFLSEHDWSQVFRTWPTLTHDWKTWYKRISDSKRADLDHYEIGQCITLSLADIARNEPMLVAASYFLSDALNAFPWTDDPNSSQCNDDYRP